MPQYVNLENVDIERIPCFYGSECHLNDVQEFLDSLPRENVEKVVHCYQCVYANNKNHKHCTCLKTNIMHAPNYFCADGKENIE